MAAHMAGVVAAALLVIQVQQEVLALLEQSVSSGPEQLVHSHQLALAHLNF